MIIKKQFLCFFRLINMTKNHFFNKVWINVNQILLLLSLLPTEQILLSWMFLERKTKSYICRLFSFKSNSFLFNWIAHLLHDNDISSRVIFALLILLVVKIFVEKKSHICIARRQFVYTYITDFIMFDKFRITMC